MRRAAWLYDKQGGKCFLVTSAECRAAGGALSPETNAPGGRGWTWEHVIPKGICRRLNVRASLLVMLACRKCNNAKGAALPTDEHLAMAIELSREWHAVSFAADLNGNAR